jgi:hypothetical protein
LFSAAGMAPATAVADTAVASTPGDCRPAGGRLLDGRRGWRGVQHWRCPLLGLGGRQLLGSSRVRFHLPVVAIAATSDGAGYWLVYQDGRVEAFGDATSPTRSSSTEWFGAPKRLLDPRRGRRGLPRETPSSAANQSGSSTIGWATWLARRPSSATQMARATPLPRTTEECSPTVTFPSPGPWATTTSPLPSSQSHAPASSKVLRLVPWQSCEPGPAKAIPATAAILEMAGRRFFDSTGWVRFCSLVAGPLWRLW